MAKLNKAASKMHANALNQAWKLIVRQYAKAHKLTIPEATELAKKHRKSIFKKRKRVTS